MNLWGNILTHVVVFFSNCNPSNKVFFQTVKVILYIEDYAVGNGLYTLNNSDSDRIWQS